MLEECKKFQIKLLKTFLASCIVQIIFVGSILMASLFKVSQVRNKDGRGRAEMAAAKGEGMANGQSRLS